MWKRFHKRLSCPACASKFDLKIFQSQVIQLEDKYLTLAREKKLLDDDFNQYVDYGVLLCRNCRHWVPISNGLPILLTYKTSLHARFASDFSEQLMGAAIRNCGCPAEDPVVGEQFVLASFSKEWADYEYDGVLWEANYDDLERRFLKETNLSIEREANVAFLEVGCGLGVTTHLAQKNYNVDAVGVDLSQSVFQAARHYIGNPFLHFVQASVFHLPFPKRAFDVVYSRGALHHTFSTYEAVKCLARCARPGAFLYLWVYGKRSIDDNLFRKFAYSLEALIRPILSKRPDAPVSKALLALVAFGYIGFNKLRHMRDHEVQKYDFGRAVHAARDRFTPMFAHRHEPAEVCGWFRELGFSEVEVVDWKVMPSVERADFRRNIGIRGRRLEDENQELTT
jgi:SAM-dependent methyltransferase/uncharacterized protein YbaR (Trm112 family)